MSDESPTTKYQDPGQYWREQLDHAQKIFDDWTTRAGRVVERYRDERSATERTRTKFNILWSNVQVLTPSLYGRAAKPEVSRRYMDADPVGRLASTILERVLDYECQQFPDYDAAMRQSVEDRLLPGRGTAWARYEPVIVQESMPAPEGVEVTNTEPLVVERIDSAHAPIDYIFWKDFLHSPARTWDEVWWVARWVYMTADEGEQRFGSVFRNVPLSASYTEDGINKKSKTKSDFAKKAQVAEIWNKRTGKVCWIAKDYAQSLDEKDDPLQLEGFFPCPKPLFATTTNGSLIPVPDYIEYEDQARELDDLTGRISNLVRAIKAVGVFNAEFKELGRLFNEGIDNKLIPVTNWAALAEKQGLKGAVDLLDISVQIQALSVLYKAREDVKQTIYEICGISDILRGSTKAEETLGAQQLKANFGSLRLKDSQTDVARFASDLFRLKAEIICKFYPPQLIIQMSGIAGTPDGQDPQMLQQAVAMLQNAVIRDFHIAVESDTLAQIDDAAEKQAAMEAVKAISDFMQQALPAVQEAPETLPMVSEILLFLVRRYRAGRALESSIERAMKALEAKAGQMAQNPKPTPEQIKAQTQMQADQARIQADTQAAQMKAQFDKDVQQGKLQQEMQLEQLKAQQEERQSKLDGQVKLAGIAMQEKVEVYKADLAAKTQKEIAQMQCDCTAATASQSTDLEKMKLRGSMPPDPPPMILVKGWKPTTKRIHRDSAGRITHVVEEGAPADETLSTDGAPATVVSTWKPSVKRIERDGNGNATAVMEEEQP